MDRTRNGSRRRGTLMVALAVLALALTVAAGCGGSSGDNGGGGGTSASPSGDQPIYRLGMMNTGYDSLNPFVGYYSNSYAAWMLMYPNLAQYSSDLQVQPDFAESWTTSADALTWTFKLRADAVWTDGQPITAKDAAFTINTVVKFQGTAAAVLSPFVPGIKSATAVDDTTLEIKLAQPSAALIANLYQLPILPEHVWSKYATGDGAKLKTVSMDPADGPVVCSGPFELQKLDYKGTTIFKRVDTFYGPKPLITGYGFQWFTNTDAAIQALKAGQIDCVFNLPPSAAAPIKSDAGLQIQGFGGGIPYFLAVNDSKNNTKHSELNNVQVREALSLAIDRDTIISSVFAGFAQPGGSLLLNQYVPQFMTEDVPVTARDVARANELLDGLGYAKGSDGIRTANGVKMEYTVLVSTGTRAIDSRVVDVLKQSFAEIGVGLQQKVLDNTLQAVFAGAKPYSDFDMLISMFGLTPDPDWSLMIPTSQMLGVYNLVGYSNPEYDKLWSQQTSEMDADKRKAIIDQMSALLQKDQVFAPISYVQIVTAWNNKWQGVPEGGSPFGYYHYLNKTQFNALAVQQ
jgi:peptide/nickel transport system substrate-binding protein